jgi:hypothetical protein
MRYRLAKSEFTAAPAAVSSKDLRRGDGLSGMIDIEVPVDCIVEDDQ